MESRKCNSVRLFERCHLVLPIVSKILFMKSVLMGEVRELWRLSQILDMYVGEKYPALPFDWRNKSNLQKVTASFPNIHDRALDS
jgi:hypothetical protein